MNQYELLMDKAHAEGIRVIEKDFNSKAKGLCKGNKIAIRKDISTSKEKACILAEELGHYYTTVVNIINLQDTNNRKQERAARLWAYNKQIGLLGIISAFKANCCNSYDMANHLGVTEDFLQEAIECYRRIHGVGVMVQNYFLQFEPHLQIHTMMPVEY